MDCIETYKNYKDNIKPYKEWEKNQDLLDKKRQYLFEHRNISQDELNKSKTKAETILRAVDIMDEYSEKKAEDVEALTQVLQGYAPVIGAVTGLGISKLINSSNKYQNYLNTLSNNPGKVALIKSSVTFLPVAIGFIASLSAATIYFTKMQRDASAIARFQSIKDELSNPKNFVDFNPEQIQQAKDIAKTLKPENQKEASPLNPINNVKEIYQTFKSISKDKKAFKKWEIDIQNKENNRKKMFSAKLNDDIIKNADENKDLITRIITKIDMASQKYSEDAEMTASLFMIVCSLGGFMTGLLARGIKRAAEKIGLVKVNSNLSNVLLKNSSLILGLIGAVAGSLYSLKYQKEATKVGKFKEKHEFLNNPANYINFSKEDMEEVKLTDLPPTKKSMWQKFKGIFTSISTLKQDFKAYEDYKKTARNEEANFRKALLQIDTTEEQLKDAKKLQSNVFRSFNKMDESSQRYAEDMETLTDIAIPIVSQVLSFGLSSASSVLLPKTNFFNKLNPTNQTVVLTSFLTVPLVLFGIAAQYITTKLQKDSSKVGLMKAIQELDDAKNFVSDEELMKANNTSEFSDPSNIAFNHDLSPKSNNEILNWLEKISK